MKKLLSVIILALFVGSVALPAFAAVTAQSAGTNLGAVERVNFSTGLTATKAGDKVTVVTSGTQAITGGTINGAVIGGTSPAAATVTSLAVDGSLYTATIAVDGAIYIQNATLDPCGTLGNNGWIFFNTAGDLCYCKGGADVKAADGSTACF